jgi:hypothetical protein
MEGQRPRRLPGSSTTRRLWTRHHTERNDRVSDTQEHGNASLHGARTV